MGGDMYHHATALLAHLGTAQPFAAATVALVLTAGGVAVTRWRNARSHS
jgi:hypothetical protein